MVKWSHYVGRRKKDLVKIFTDSNIKTYDSFVRYCKVRGIEPADQEYFDNLLEAVCAAKPIHKPPPQLKESQPLKEKIDPPAKSKSMTSPKKPIKSLSSKKKRPSRGKK